MILDTMTNRSLVAIDDLRGFVRDGTGPPAPAVRYAKLRFRERLGLHSAGEGLTLVHGSGRNAPLEVPAGWFSVSMALSGSFLAEGPYARWTLVPGRVLVWNDALRIKGSGIGDWLALLGSPEAWGRAGIPGAISELFPDEAACPRDQVRLLVRLTRVLRGTRRLDDDVPDLLAHLYDSIHGQQAGLRGLLSRCSRRSHEHQRQMLVRLLRIRHMIRSMPEEDVDLASLSERANYSTWHLARVFQNVFGETPADYSARTRLERALELVRHSSLPIFEVAEATGFASQSAFARAFKRSHGVTPTEARRIFRADHAGPGEPDDAPALCIHAA